MKKVKIAMGCDHNGFIYKENLKNFLKGEGYIIKDFGQFDGKSLTKDYIVAEKVALNVTRKLVDKGILICGSGIGMSIAANKIPGCLASLCFNLFTAENARKRSNANILALGSKTIDIGLARKIVLKWLGTDFERGEGDKRNIERMGHLLEIDHKYKKMVKVY